MEDSLSLNAGFSEYHIFQTDLHSERERELKVTKVIQKIFFSCDALSL